MPYESLSDLPDSVRNVLPKHAQEIFQAAFNSAWNEYKDPGDRRGNDTREEVSFKVAWAAVKTKYTSDGDHWVKR
ncbi:ChaB family protein [Pseudomaricurvus sp.]|uniref:ChaB family protein n=1 Tax=Pseudomaricurvus sp. TaxID=2004510 RepID=UPI003F6C3CA9